MVQIILEIIDTVLNGQNMLATSKVEEALKTGIDPIIILNEGLIAAMTEVGRRYEEGEFYVPEMLIAARAMRAGMEVLKPRLKEVDVKTAGKVVISTVKGDLHDIGKNLVAMMLEGAGFEINDLGIDVSPEKIIEAIREYKPDIVAISALLTTTMTNMKITIEALTAAGLRDGVKIMIGGAPVTDVFAQQIGADGYALDASRAVTLAKSLVQS
jgi:5-methyltetrahydrofolate--homocysteine methyltransferase